MKKFLHPQKSLFVLLLLLFAGMGTAYAYGFSATCSTGQTLYYNIIDATNRYVEITYPGTSTSNPWEGYPQPTGNITLPSTVTYNGNTYTVKRIGDYAFYTCSGLTGSLTIPNSVTTIGYRAFSDCSGFMGSLTIPNSVTSIGNSAFNGCSGFTGSLTISNSVTTIGHWTFLNCSGFTGSLIIPNSVTTIGMYAFENCSGFTGSLTIPNSVISIGNDAFHGCSGFTGSLTISSSVTTIDYGTFWNCSGFTGSLIIPNSVTSIGMYAFRNCSGFTGSLTLGNSVTSIGMSAFQDCSGFTGNLTIPNSVTSIGVEAFGNCSGFTGSLTIPNSVTSIGVEAFGNCSGFTGSLTLPNSVTSIGNYAFYGCSGFTGSLTLPNSVTSIGNYTFYNCTGFTGSLTLPNSVTSIGNYAFYNCTGFTGSLTLPNSVASIGNAAFRDCSGFTGTLTLPNSVTSIGNYAFYNCYGFTGTLTLPSSVTTIGDEAFRNCYGFTSMIVYPETPPTLGTYVFFGVPKTIPVTVPCGTLSAYQNFSGWNAFTNLREYCDPLTYSINADGVSVTVTGHVDGTAATGELIIPETKTINGVTYAVTAIGENAFNACSGFSGSLTIPNSVTTIGNYAFYGCIGLTGLLTLPNSVTTIGNYAFSNCSGFTGSLTLPNSVTTIGNYAFRNCSGFTGSLTLPNSVTAIGSYAFRGCTGFTGTLTLPNSVASIGNYAFANCSGFTGSLTFPNSVTSIGICAFYYCSGFTGMLTIPNSVTSIGHRAFYYCGGFTGPLTLPNSVTTIGNEAFHGCTGFTGSLTIGTGVTSIGQGAFRYCAGFTSMTVYPQTPPTLGSEVFFYVPTTIPVYVLCSSMEDYQAASQWSAFTDMQCIQEALTVYDGSTLSYYLPAYIYYFDEFTKSQFVIPAADLADMTGTPISSMTFYTTGSSVPYTTVSSADVYLKEVNYTHISAFEPKASATTVYSGYLDIVSAGNGGEMTINFSIPYTYNGGNLLVGIENTEKEEWRSIYFYGKDVNGASVSGSSSSSLGSIQPTQQNFIPKTTFSYTPSACSSPTGLTATDITSNSAMLNWTGFQEDYDLRYKKNDETGEWETLYNIGSSYSLGTLEPATEYEWQVRGRDCDGSGTYTGWSAARSFTTTLCPLEDQCELTFELTDGYGDGWNGAAIRVVDAESNILIASMSASNHGLSNTTTTDTYTLAVCDGRELRFEWVNGSFNSECSYTVTNSNGDEIFSGSGAMSAPVTYMVRCSAAVQTIALSAGTNWFSTNVEITLEDLQSALVAAMPGTTNIVIQSKTQSTTYNGTRWRGQLNTLDVVGMYKITVTDDCEISLTGTPINPAEHPVSIPAGQVVWIGFPFSESMTPADAFAGFATNGDEVSSKTQSTTYNGTRWRGQLNSLEPGKGYIYKSASTSDRTFTFPTSSK